MKRILVTGAAGFLGSNLCERLLAKGNSIICIDDFSTGFKESIAHLLTNSNFELIEHDICDPIDIEIDEIYNLACPASPVAYQRDPIKTIKASIYGSFNMLSLAKKQCIKILQTSTSEIYGESRLHAQAENYWGSVNPVGPRACYDEGKRCAETIYMSYYRQYNVAVKIARIFNTYGPKMHTADGRVVSNFIVQALNNQNLTIYGNGLQTRSFCYVDDLIDGLIRLMNSAENLTGPINLGNPAEITIIELAKEIISLTNSKSNINYSQIPQDDPSHRCPDINLAIKELNWEPTTTLTAGLKQTINYFQEK